MSEKISNNFQQKLNRPALNQLLLGKKHARRPISRGQSFKKAVARWSREESFAQAAVTRAMNELMATPEGQRNYVLNAKGYALGRLIARGWLSGDMAVFALGHGAKCCGYVRDHGEAATVAAIRHALLDGMARPYEDLTGQRDEGTTLH
jgi:hypothetical protein